MPTRNVSVRDPEREAIDRRRLQAERLMMQSQQGAPQEWNGMRIVPTYGVGQGLTQLGQALLGNKIDRDASQQETELHEQERQAMAASLQGLVPRQTIQPGQPGSGVLRPGQPAPFSSQQQAAMKSIGSLPLDQQGQILGAESANQLFPQASEGFTLAPGARRYSPQGQEIASAPPNVGGESGIPGSLQELDRINEDRAARGEAPMKPEEYLSQRRGSSSDSQLYAQYIMGLPQGMQPLPMDQFLVKYRGDIAGSEAGAKAGVIPAEDRMTAQNKMPRVEAAQRRLQRVVDASTALENNLLAGGPMQGGAIGLTEEGNELDQANAQLLTELTALTRTPGLGAQSDFEQRLAQLVLPTASMFPSVRKKALAELEEFLSDLDYQIARIGSGGQPPAPTQPVADGGDELESLLNKYAPAAQ